jgi:hypothetical protein
MNRRTFVQSATAAIGGLLVGCTDDTGGRTWLMPEELRST